MAPDNGHEDIPGGLGGDEEGDGGDQHPDARSSAAEPPVAESWSPGTGAGAPGGPAVDPTGEPVADAVPPGGEEPTADASVPGEPVAEDGYQDTDAWNGAGEGEDPPEGYPSDEWPADGTEEDAGAEELAVVDAARVGTAAPARRGPPRTRARAPATRSRRSSPTAARSRPSAPPSARDRSRRTTIVILSVLSVAVVAIAVIALSLGGRTTGNKTALPSTTVAASALPTLGNEEFTTFDDPETGMSLRYPRTWQKLGVPVREIRLVAVDPTGQYSVRIRFQRTEQVTTPENVKNLQTIADGSVVGPNIKVLKRDILTQNGMIGFRYLYTLTDTNTGLEGAHLHYFLFQGHKMNQLIFQALPTGDFTRIEGIFNQMLDSFRSAPEPTTTTPPAAPPSSTPG